MTYYIHESEIVVSPDGSGRVVKGFDRDTCPNHSGSANCECDLDRTTYNAGLDAIEYLLLALACKGVHIDGGDFQSAVRDAIDACNKHFSG
jgi:hypothetical protein